MPLQGQRQPPDPRAMRMRELFHLRMQRFALGILWTQTRVRPPMRAGGSWIAPPTSAADQRHAGRCQTAEQSQLSQFPTIAMTSRACSNGEHRP